MDEIHLIKYFLIFFVTLIQTVVGTGVLIIGTPILLLMNYEMVDIMLLLLPISIVTSLFNLLINKKKNNFKKIFYKSELKSFFLICIPSIILGLFLLKKYSNYLNFDILVAIIILLTVMISDKLKFYKYFFVEKINKIINLLIGIVHGLTNCGGSLLSLFVISKGDENKNTNFYKITFFYFFLASFQYLLVIYIFGIEYNLSNTYNLFYIVFFGTLLGNYFFRKINIFFFKFTVKLLSMISVVMLIGKNIY